MARNIKENFVDGLVKIAIFLSLLKTNWRDVGTNPGITENVHFHASNLGQLEVSPIINIYDNNRWNPVLGASVHPKHVENDRIEDVLRRVHRLAGYRSYENIDTRIEAFLLEDGTEARLPVTHGVNNQATNLNPGEEPSKDDMDLIDVLWRQDIDLEGLEDVSLIRELEKSEEIRLHKKQEEETIEQLIHTLNSSQHLNDSESDESLNTPEALNDQQTPNFHLYHSSLNDESEQISLWQNSISTLVQPHQHHFNALPLSNLTSTNHTHGPTMSPTSTLHAMGEAASFNNFSLYQTDNLIESSTNLSDGLLVNDSDANISLNEENNVDASIEEDTFINGLLSNVSLNTQQNVPQVQTSRNVVNSCRPTREHNDEGTFFVTEANINEQFGSLEDILGMEGFSGNFFPMQSAQEDASDLLITPTVFKHDSLQFPPIHNNQDQDRNGKFDDHDNFAPFEEALSEDIMMYELAEDSQFMELFSEHLDASSDDVAISSDSAMSSTAEGGRRGSSASKKGFASAAFEPFHVSQSVDLHEESYNDQTFVNHSLPHQHTDSLPNFAQDSTFFQLNNHTNLTNHDHNYCLPPHVSSIKPDPDSMPTCSRFISNQPVSESIYSDVKFKTPLHPVRKSTRRSSLKQKSPHDDEDEYINPGGIDDECYDEDDKDYTYTYDTKELNFTFKYSQKTKKLVSAVSPSASCRGKDDLKAVQMGIPYDVDEIIHCQAERFSEMVANKSLSGEQIQLIKDIRKRGKNKLAAQNCRKRKLDVITTLEEEIENLKVQQETEIERRQKSLSMLEDMKKKMVSLQDQILSSLRDSMRGTTDSGQNAGGEDELVIEQTSSGGVFIVPRNDSTTEINSRARRKRK